MSTKTTIKRIALVAVSALGLGMMSTVGASAATNVASFNILSSSASSVDALTATSDTLAYTASGYGLVRTPVGSSIALASTDVGRGLWTSKYGYLGKIASVTDSVTATLTGDVKYYAAGGTSTTTLSGSSVATGSFWIGTKASAVTGDGITLYTINGMSTTSGKYSLLDLQLDAATAASDTARARISVGGTVLGTSATPATGDNHMILPFTNPVLAGTYTATVTLSPLAQRELTLQQ